MQDRDELSASFIIAVDNGAPAAVFQVFGEKGLFTGPLVRHVFMVIEVVPAQVGEDCCGKTAAVYPLEV